MKKFFINNIEICNQCPFFCKNVEMNWAEDRLYFATYCRYKGNNHYELWSGPKESENPPNLEIPKWCNLEEEKYTV